MFSYAVKPIAMKADLHATNEQNLTPLTLASRLGRCDLFNEIMQLQSYVSINRLQQQDPLLGQTPHVKSPQSDTHRLALCFLFRGK